jgi:SH3-like domain-containing protein
MRARLLFPLPLLLLLSGCSYFRQKAAERYVYVTARQTYLRDRVAAVSNRTGSASNGEKLVVLERARRFLKVRTPRGEVGWIEEKLTADQHTADEFEALRTDHQNDPVVAAAAARDEVYLHIAPGRETERFYRLAEGDQVNLLERATVAKVSSDKPSPAAKPPAKPVPAATPPATPAATSAQPIPPAKSPADDPATDTPAVPAPPPAMEDWWLVRDSKGQTGWLYSRMIDVAEPDVLSRYSEGQRIVGAYILDHANDPDSGVLDNGVVVTSIPEYVTVLSPYKAGLPYDFDQVRVFIWNTRKHRYETSFRERNIVGYLPVQIALKTDPYVNTPLGHTPLPSFTYRVLSADSPIPTPDPDTGIIHPGKLITKTIRLEGNIGRRILPPNTQPPAEAHPVPDAPKDKGKGKHKHKP